MNDYRKEYEKWLAASSLDADLKKELEEIKDREDEIKDRFYCDLSFGTAGLRGILGAGTNRMNKNVVGRATKALGMVIKSQGEDFAKKGVAIAHDCRIMSPEFAEMCALIFNSMGIKVYLFDSLRPTPELSYAVRYYKCAAGINITASHNPKIYNGYKVYWEEGSQIKSGIANQILEEIGKLDLFEEAVLPTREEAIEKGLLVIINKEVDESFYEKTMSISLRDSEVDKNIGVVYTPLNGAGNIPVRTVLERMGYTNVHIVKEQELPDGTFPTIAYPNPEDHAAFALSEKLALEVGADVLIATDPDCDRLAVEVVQNGKIEALNGNQVGVLIINYLLTSMAEKGTLPKNAAMVKSIVTGEMGSAIAKAYGVKMFNVLTGFKNICALSNEWDSTKEYTYVFGYEESIGYNVGSYLRDKDGVGATLILTEMAGYYKKQGKTLIDVLNGLYEKYGYYRENTISIVLEGIEGQERIGRMMVEYRKNNAGSIGSSKLVTVTDYLTSEAADVLTGEKSTVDIEKTDAVQFTFDDGCWYTLRPSGTEPKIKLYIYTKADTAAKAEDKLKEIETKVLEVLHGIQ
ncbi:phospho-sugar mutase [Anaerocolumna xylanovorans]|uniref:phosphoglucomutase (alpha-D-glucose-1,6-bisphosphate-dependent) n=1 Tax=Anaerocolumna xylanovorans DSM 12503 TaxID=1121345 RepID=A0A1M7Y550_9FIRM|nr:phospho-sugar mutase [Anaerocolumna xylanovorans]SHO47459.1 phosphoglucomutase [Anaerocolumna xylanovorans DSM 12503]